MNLILQKILSIGLILFGFVIGVLTPFFARYGRTPELSHQAIVFIGFILTIIGIRQLIAITRCETKKSALEIAATHGASNDVHHLRWIVDQMTQALTQCHRRPDGKQIVTDEYRKIVDSACNVRNALDILKWNVGTKPE